jgi:hypothetical protein
VPSTSSLPAVVVVNTSWLVVRVVVTRGE